VGQDKDSLALMGRTDFRRAEYSPRCSVTQSCQVFDNVGQSQADMSFDVFKETNGWSHGSNSICDPRPEVSCIVFASPLACCAEWLAWVTTREDVHLSVKFLVWECLKIRPDRC
jgi:hypothetical protein